MPGHPDDQATSDGDGPSGRSSTRLSSVAVRAVSPTERLQLRAAVSPRCARHRRRPIRTSYARAITLGASHSPQIRQERKAPEPQIAARQRWLIAVDVSKDRFDQRSLGVGVFVHIGPVTLCEPPLELLVGASILE